MALIGSVHSYNVDYLVIAGGGGGGDGNSAGGGGAGGYRVSYASETSGGLGGYNEQTPKFQKGSVYTIRVGAGGGTWQNGMDSWIDGVGCYVKSVGGGAGGGRSNWPGAGGLNRACWNGGSGGTGGGGGSTSTNIHGNDDECYGGMGIPGQGYSGGRGIHDPAHWEGGGGGGGAGQVGQDNQTATGGKGGDGKSSSITGSAVIRGGGGGASGNSYGAAGSGGGGAGGSGGAAGTANTGGGGGGLTGGGGSGVVILRMATSDYSGTTSGSPTVTTSGSDTIITYNASGTYTA